MEYYMDVKFFRHVAAVRSKILIIFANPSAGTEIITLTIKI